MSEHAESGDSSENRPRPHASTLSERDAAILEFEYSWPVQSGAKEEAIRQRFAISAARYYQVLNALIDTPAAVRHDPMLVKRLQRLRHSRVGPRSRPQGGSGRSSQTRHDD
ncbi:DUF3263 domain-containing protein [Marisediminicola senii]|uniref:DUF3263 domain-containing protein n=1 Tax=Marisediminicola senii TaxID=2711233 RepID=UPI0013EA9F2D|nr:DUF3263 domain-containing protein [Marisediminicola senii]